MAKIHDIGSVSYRPERKHPRFSIRYPAHVMIRSGNEGSELQGYTSNISLEGVLLEVESPISPGCNVSFAITVQEHPIVGPLQLVAEGEVVRVEPRLSGREFAIAVKCKGPISQLADYLPASAS